MSLGKLKSGDIISLFEEERQSFLTADPIEGVSLVDGSSFPVTVFRDALFRVTKFDKTKPRGNAGTKSAVLIAHGDHIQLEHIMTSQFLAVKMRHSTGNSSTGHLQAVLEAATSAESVFELGAGSRMASVCEPVEYNDLITLRAPKWLQYIQVNGGGGSEKRLQQQQPSLLSPLLSPPLSVVANDKRGTKFSAVPFRSAADTTEEDNFLCGGSTLRLRHRELDASLMYMPPEPSFADVSAAGPGRFPPSPPVTFPHVDSSSSDEDDESESAMNSPSRAPLAGGAPSLPSSSVRLKTPGALHPLKGRSSRSLFILTLMRSEWGGKPVAFGRPFCLLHFATRQYLCVNGGKLSMCAMPDHATTYFAFQRKRPISSSATDSGLVCLSDTLCLQHVDVQAGVDNPVFKGWLHANRYFNHGAGRGNFYAGKSVDTFTDLGGVDVTPVKYECDTFSLSLATEDELSDVRVVTGFARYCKDRFTDVFTSEKFIEQVKTHIKQNTTFDNQMLSNEMRAFSASTLELLMQCTAGFVKNSPLPSLQSALTLEKESNLMTQLLLLETSVIHNVIGFMKALSYSGQHAGVRISDVVALFPNSRMTHLVRLLNRLMRQAALNFYDTSARLDNELAFWVGNMNGEMGFTWVLEQVMKDNEARLRGSQEQRLNKDQVLKMTASVARMQNPSRGFRLLQSLCTCNAVPVAQNQNLVGAAIFDSDHTSALLHPAAAFVDVNVLKTLGGPKSIQPPEGSTVVSNFNRSFVVDFIQLLASLCEGQDARNNCAQWVMDWLCKRDAQDGKRAVFDIIAETTIHPELRAAFFKLTDALFVDVAPSMPIHQVVLTREWGQQEYVKANRKKSDSCTILLDILLKHFTRMKPESFYEVDTAAALHQLRLLILFGHFNDARVLDLQRQILVLASDPTYFTVSPKQHTERYTVWRQTTLALRSLLLIINQHNDNDRLTKCIRFVEENISRQSKHEPNEVFDNRSSEESNSLWAVKDLERVLKTVPSLAESPKLSEFLTGLHDSVESIVSSDSRLTDLLTHTGERMLGYDDSEIRHAAWDIMFLNFLLWKELKLSVSSSYIVIKKGSEGEIDLSRIIHECHVLFEALHRRETKNEGTAEQKEVADASVIDTVKQLTARCFFQGRNSESPCPRFQKIFQVKGVYEAVFRLLAWEVSDFVDQDRDNDDAPQADLEVEEACCGFLIAFVQDNAANKQVMFDSPLFAAMVPLVAKVPMVAKVMKAIVEEDFRLCMKVTRLMVFDYAAAVKRAVPDAEILSFFTVILKAKGETVQKSQGNVLAALLEHPQLLEPLSSSFLEDCSDSGKASHYHPYQVALMGVLSLCIKDPMSRVQCEIIISYNRLPALLGLSLPADLKHAVLRFVTASFLKTPQDASVAATLLEAICSMKHSKDFDFAQQYLDFCAAYQALFTSQRDRLAGGYSNDFVTETESVLSTVCSTFNQFATTNKAILMAPCISCLAAILKTMGPKLSEKCGSLGPLELQGKSADVGEQSAIIVTFGKLLLDLKNVPEILRSLLIKIVAIAQTDVDSAASELRNRVKRQSSSVVSRTVKTLPSLQVAEHDESPRNFLARVENQLQNHLGAVSMHLDNFVDKQRKLLLNSMCIIKQNKLQNSSARLIKALVLSMRVEVSRGHTSISIPSKFLSESMELCVELLSSVVDANTNGSIEDERRMIVKELCTYGLPLVLFQLVSSENALREQAMRLACLCLEHGEEIQQMFYCNIQDPSLQEAFFAIVEEAMIRYSPQTIEKLVREQHGNSMITTQTVSQTTETFLLLNMIQALCKGQFQAFQSLMTTQTQTQRTRNLVVDLTNLLNTCCSGLTSLLDDDDIRRHNDVEVEDEADPAELWLRTEDNDFLTESDSVKILKTVTDEVLYVMQTAIACLLELVRGPHIDNLEHCIAAGAVRTFTVTLKLMERLQSESDDAGGALFDETLSGLKSGIWEPLGRLFGDPLQFEVDFVSTLITLVRIKGGDRCDAIMLQLEMPRFSKRLDTVFSSFRPNLPGMDQKIGQVDNNLATQYFILLSTLRDQFPPRLSGALGPLFLLKGTKKVQSVVRSVEVVRNGTLRKAYFVLSEDVRQFWPNKRIKTSRDDMLKIVNRTDRQAKLEQWWQMGLELKMQMEQMQGTSPILLRMDVFFEDVMIRMAVLINFLILIMTTAVPNTSTEPSDSFAGRYPYVNTTGVPPWSEKPEQAWMAIILTILCFFQACFAPLQFWCFFTVFAPVYIDRSKRLAVKKQMQADSEAGHPLNAPSPHLWAQSSSVGQRVHFYFWAAKVVFIENAMPSYYLGYTLCCLLGLFHNHFFFAFCLTEYVYQSSVMKQVVRSITNAGTRIFMWLLLLLFILYVAALVSFGYFRYAYQDPTKGCQTTWQCFSTHFDGLRSGGGVGAVGPQWEMEPFMLDPNVVSPQMDEFEYFRMIYSFVYYMLVSRFGIAVLNGIVVSSFAQMRSVDTAAADDLAQGCFICAISNEEFNKKRDKGFVKHVQGEHYMYNYFFFFMSLSGRDPGNFTGQESFIYQAMTSAKLEELLPFKRALCMEKGAGPVLRLDEHTEVDEAPKVGVSIEMMSSA